MLFIVIFCIHYFIDTTESKSQRIMLGIYFSFIISLSPWFWPIFICSGFLDEI